jgi:lipoate-protein ligase A
MTHLNSHNIGVLRRNTGGETKFETIEQKNSQISISDSDSFRKAEAKL